MLINMTATLAANRPAQKYDVQQLKKALNRLGYYMPPSKLGITALPDAAMFAALAQLQKHIGLKPTAQLKPNDITVEALNKELANAPNGYYVWRTVTDNKVRASHANLNGTLRQWSESPTPATDYNCRYWAEAVMLPPNPPLKPVYPETFLLPLLRVGWLYNLWQLWSYAPHKNWHLGQHKSPIRWGNQLRNRNWTPEDISETIRQGAKFNAPNKVNPTNKAIRYEYKGRFVVRDEKTKEILQISGKNFEPNN